MRSILNASSRATGIGGDIRVIAVTPGVAESALAKTVTDAAAKQMMNDMGASSTEYLSQFS